MVYTEPEACITLLHGVHTENRALGLGTIGCSAGTLLTQGLPERESPGAKAVVGDLVLVKEAAASLHLAR